ncbi:MAG: hypothetical protein AAB461_00315 [Patescibacteria group bacterium]
MNKILPKVSAVIIAVIVITGVVSVFMVGSGVWTSSTITELLPTYNLTAALGSYQVDIRSALEPGFTGAIGSVTIVGSSTTYGGNTNYTKIVPNGTTFTLTAPATDTNGALVFSRWIGCNSFTGRTCTVTINGSPRTVSASYTITRITVNSSGATAVAIVGAPTTYSGVTNYTKTTNGVAVIALTAPAIKNYAKFSKWTGCDVVGGTDNRTCNITVNAIKTVTANYVPPTLSINSIGANSVAIVGSSTTYSGTTNYTVKTAASGASFSLTAPATKGTASFSSWTGCNSVSGTGNRVCNITLNSLRIVAANYTDPNSYNITVNSTGVTAVAVIGAPTTLSGTTNYTKAVAKGTSSALTAPATSGSGNFSKWTGCDAVSGTDNRTCTIKANASRVVTAEYKIPNYTITVNSVGASAVAMVGSPTTYGGTTNYTKTVAKGTLLSLTAPATSGTPKFYNWTGCNSVGGTGNRICNVTVTALKTVTATYK